MVTPGQRQRPPRGPAQESRKQIIAAAQTLFASRGIEAVSMQDIADAAGVSRATVFNQYGSKHMVLDALAARSLAVYRTLLQDALGDATTATPLLLRRLYAQMGEGLERNSALYRELFIEIRKISMGLDANGEAPSLKRETFLLLEQIFARGQKRSEIKLQHSAAALATAYDSLLSGAVIRWLHSEEDQRLTALLDDLAEVFLDGAAY